MFRLELYPDKLINGKMNQTL